MKLETGFIRLKQDVTSKGLAKARLILRQMI
jgi:hypothetical protein